MSLKREIILQKDIIRTQRVLTMLNLMIKKKYIDNLSFEFSKLKVEKPIIKAISRSDLNKIIRYFNSHAVLDKNKLLFMLITTTGIRTTELLNIKNSNVDLKNLRIYLEFTKTNYPRFIYIKKELIPLFNKVMSNKTYLFNDDFGNQMTDKL